MVTIKQFTEVYAILSKEWEDVLEREMNVVAAFKGIPIKQVEEYSIDYLKAEVERINKLLSESYREGYSKYIRIKGLLFKTDTRLNKSKAGQYIDLKALATDKPLENLHIIAAIFCRPVFRKYNGATMPARAKFFYENMPAEYAYAIMMFFFRLLEILTVNIQASLQAEVLKVSQ